VRPRWTTKKTLSEQPLIFRGLFFDGGRETSDTVSSQAPRLRTGFDIAKTRGFERRAREF